MKIVSNSLGVESMDFDKIPTGFKLSKTIKKSIVYAIAFSIMALCVYYKLYSFLLAVSLVAILYVSIRNILSMVKYLSLDIDQYEYVDDMEQDWR